jgi:hypothetical protein
MDNAFMEAFPPQRAGLPGKDISLFNIALLDPVLKGGVKESMPAKPCKLVVKGS